MPSKKKREDLPLFLSPDQAAKISGLGVNRIRQLMEDGHLYIPETAVQAGKAIFPHTGIVISFERRRSGT